MQQDTAVVQPARPDDWTPWIYLGLDWQQEGRQPPAVALSITFGRHHVNIPGGRIWFGLRGGELALRPSGGQFSNGHFWPQNPLEVKVEVKRTLRTEQSRKLSQSASAKADLEPLTAGFNYGSGSEISSAQIIEDAAQFVHWRISSHGSPIHAIWSFEAAPGEPCLDGRLVAQAIARFASAAEIGTVNAQFSVFKKDIRPLAAEGLWPEDISNSKRAVLGAWIRKLIAKRMGPVVYDLDLPAPVTEVRHG